MKEVFNKIWELALPYQDKRDDAGHAEVTLKYATKLLTLEQGNEDVVIPAIILHDVGYSQLTKERRLSVFNGATREEDRRAAVCEHQVESVKIAVKILRKVNYPDVLVDEILEIISQHDSREGFISKNEGIVRDADKLWRTSREGFEAARERAKAREADTLTNIEKMINRPNYFYSEMAKQMALSEAKRLINPGDLSRAAMGTTMPITDEFMRQAISQSKNYVVVFLRHTQKRNDPGTDKIIWEHGRRNFTFRANGHLPIVCPINDGSEYSGVGIFNSSLEETRKIMEEDPGVKAGIFKYELHVCRSFPGSCLPSD